MAALRVLCAGAAKAPFGRVLAAFEQQAGLRADCRFAAVGTLVQMLEDGEPADLVVLNSKAVARLQRDGRLGEAAVALGTVGVALAVRAAASGPEVQTQQQLRAALLAADSLAYGDPAHGDSSGVHFHGVLQSLGIAEAVAHKARLAPSGLKVAEWVRDGEVALGATQSSVIRATAGVRLLAMLPDGVQQLTTYVAAPVAGCGPEALALLDALQAPSAAACFRDAGFLPA